MSKKKRKTITITVEFDLGKELRRLSHEGRVFDLREGRKHRSTTFKSKKAYKRKPKHKGGSE